MAAINWKQVLGDMIGAYQSVAPPIDPLGDAITGVKNIGGSVARGEGVVGGIKGYAKDTFNKPIVKGRMALKSIFGDKTAGEIERVRDELPPDSANGDKFRRLRAEAEARDDESISKRVEEIKQLMAPDQSKIPDDLMKSIMDAEAKGAAAQARLNGRKDTSPDDISALKEALGSVPGVPNIKPIHDVYKDPVDPLEQDPVVKRMREFQARYPNKENVGGGNVFASATNVQGLPPGSQRTIIGNTFADEFRGGQSSPDLPTTGVAGINNIRSGSKENPLSLNDITAGGELRDGPPPRVNQAIVDLAKPSVGSGAIRATQKTRDTLKEMTERTQHQTPEVKRQIAVRERNVQRDKDRMTAVAVAGATANAKAAAKNGDTISPAELRAEKTFVGRYTSGLATSRGIGADQTPELEAAAAELQEVFRDKDGKASYIGMEKIGVDPQHILTIIRDPKLMAEFNDGRRNRPNLTPAQIAEWVIAESQPKATA